MTVAFAGRQWSPADRAGADEVDLGLNARGRERGRLLVSASTSMQSWPDVPATAFVLSSPQVDEHEEVGPGRNRAGGAGDHRAVRARGAGQWSAVLVRVLGPPLFSRGDCLRTLSASPRPSGTSITMDASLAVGPLFTTCAANGRPSVPTGAGWSSPEPVGMHKNGVSTEPTPGHGGPGATRTGGAVDAPDEAAVVVPDVVEVLVARAVVEAGRRGASRGAGGGRRRRSCGRRVSVGGRAETDHRGCGRGDRQGDERDHGHAGTTR